MKFPSGSEYSDAVQNPDQAFIDQDLRACIVECNQLQLPKPYSGGFTTTFRLKNKAKKTDWAVRCFTRDIGQLQDRYQSIQTFFASHKESFFVPTQCISKGICIRGVWYPVIKMQWVSGLTLDAYIRTQVHRPNCAQLFSNLSKGFIDTIRRMEQIQFAHGDLQHGNIIVDESGVLKLIDYDGVFVPSLSTLKSNNFGHINYQHPSRKADEFHPKLDRFSAILIFLALRALENEPNLWNQFDDSESILFHRDDFLKPLNSRLFNLLSQYESLKRYADAFKIICQTDLQFIPTLDEFIAGKKSSSVSKPVQIEAPWYIPRTQYEIVESTDVRLRIYEGQRIEVIGKVTDIKFGTTKYGSPFVRVVFGIQPYPNNRFLLVLWAKGLKQLSEKNIKLEDLKNQWVGITGVLSIYRGTPQVIYDSSTNIQIFSSKAIAMQRIDEFKERSSRAPTYDTTNVTTHVNPAQDMWEIDNEASVKLNELYAAKSNNMTPGPSNNTWYSDQSNSSINVQNHTSKQSSVINPVQPVGAASSHVKPNTNTIDHSASSSYKLGRAIKNFMNRIMKS